MDRRRSIGGLMILVAFAAFDLAGAVAATRVPDLIIAAYTCGPIAVAVQFALHRSAFGRRASRPFWSGFASSGAATAAALYWSYFRPPYYEAFSGAYTSFWDSLGRVAPALERAVSAHEWSIHAAFALFYFVPQALMAVAAGALADRVARAAGRRSKAGASSAPTRDG